MPALQTLGQMGANPLAAAQAVLARPLSIEIRIPQLPYGSVGVEVPHALLRVSGGDWPAAVSRGPTDAEPGPMAYFPASGRVRIDAYDALELRGSFEADMVEDPVPTSSRGDRPTLPVLGRIAGRFSIGQPWRGDPAYVAQAPSMEDVDFDIHERMLGSGQADADDKPSKPQADRDRAPPKPAADGRSPPTAGGQAAAGCDCSCAGYRSLLQRLGLAGSEQSSQQQVVDAARQSACFVTCGTAYASCDDDEE